MCMTTAYGIFYTSPQICIVLLLLHASSGQTAGQPNDLPCRNSYHSHSDTSHIASYVPATNSARGTCDATAHVARGHLSEKWQDFHNSHLVWGLRLCFW